GGTEARRLTLVVHGTRPAGRWPGRGGAGTEAAPHEARSGPAAFMRLHLRPCACRRFAPTRVLAVAGRRGAGGRLSCPSRASQGGASAPSVRRVQGPARTSTGV